MNTLLQNDSHLSVPEHDEQVAYFDFVRWRALSDKRYECIVAIPNAGKRSWTHGRAMKREGLSKGFPDIAILVPTRKYPGAFIELKIGKNRTTSEQDEWLHRLTVQGYSCAVLYGAQKAIEWTTAYMGDKR